MISVTPTPDPVRRYSLALREWLATQPAAHSESERTRQMTTFRILFRQTNGRG